MAITYTLYCKSCYERLKRSEDEKPAKVRPYTSYFVCSCCSCETDRGYAAKFEQHSGCTEKRASIGVS